MTNSTEPSTVEHDNTPTPKGHTMTNTESLRELCTRLEDFHGSSTDADDRYIARVIVCSLYDVIDDSGRTRSARRAMWLAPATAELIADLVEEHFSEDYNDEDTRRRATEILSDPTYC